MSFRPGTVSKILWHFTGGPKWDDVTNKQLSELKPAQQGFDALRSIVQSKELRVGNYREVVKVILKEKRRRNLETRKLEILKNHLVTISSSPVCCVADIPLQHTAYHANRYGKIAIGFHRDAIVHAGFNPVMYSLENTNLLNHIYNGYSAIDEVDPSSAKWELENLEESVNELFVENELDETVDINDVDWKLSDIEQGHESILASFDEILSYIKTFDRTEFDSIYCEREWRSTSNFNFTIDDIAMIVLPKNQEGENFYQNFIDTTTLPRSVTIACWEDLIEH